MSWTKQYTNSQRHATLPSKWHAPQRNQEEGKNPPGGPNNYLSSNCRCLFNRAKAGNEDTNWLNYKFELASHKKAIRRAKRRAWQTFCSDIEKTTDAARLRKILSKTAAPLGYLQKADGSWSDSSKESLDLLLTLTSRGANKQVIHLKEEQEWESK